WQPDAARCGERAIALDRHPLPCQPRKNGRLVARAGSYFKHAMMRTNRKLLGHVGDHIGLTDGLAARDRQRMIRIRIRGEIPLHEMFARDLVESTQDSL